LAYSPDGKLVAGGTRVSIIKIWDSDTGHELATLHDRYSRTIALMFSPDSRFLVSCGENWDNPDVHWVDGKNRAGVTVWNVNTWTIRHELRDKEHSSSRASFSPDGRLLAMVCCGDPVTFWDVDLGRKIQTLPTTTQSIIGVAFSPDGETLAMSQNEVGIRLWDVKNLRERAILQTWPCDPIFSPDSNTLAIIAGQVVELWSVERGARIRVFQGHEDRVTSVCFSPDGTLLATGSWDKTIRVWNVATGNEVAVFAGHGRGCVLVFSPDGKILASGSGKTKEPGQVFLWDVRDVLKER
jgi:WD40 repeat protein